MQELQSMGNVKIMELWLRYFKAQPIIVVQKMIRNLWYKIQCESHNLQIEQKNITRLNRYSTDPDKYVENSYKTKYHIKNGMEITKTFKGQEYKVYVKSSKEFIYNDQTFKTLSAVALAICKKKVSGYDFFGLNNKLYEKSIVEDGGTETVINSADAITGSDNKNMTDDYSTDKDDKVEITLEDQNSKEDIECKR
jgi:hypothetical protein